MLIFISPAKSLEWNRTIPFEEKTLPVFLKETTPIVKVLKKMSVSKIKKTFDLSDKLAELNYNRFQKLGMIDSIEMARPAIFSFDGDVYTGFDAFSLQQESLFKTQEQLRILSGLYGVLKPLDEIEPYRLEMGSSISWGKYKNLYDYWKPKVTKWISDELDSHQEKTLINLASQEYFNVIDRKKLGHPILDVEFLEDKGTKMQNVSFFSKKARGTMARYILDYNLKIANELKGFDLDGYSYHTHLSLDHKFVFTRKSS